jgi:NADH-quinone oxidoreductase subunit C
MISEELQTIPAVQAVAAEPGALLEGKREFGETVLVIQPVKIVPICRMLKEKQGFERLAAVTALDWHPMEPRFEVVYQLHSIRNNVRLRLKCRLEGHDPAIESVCSVWKAADWYEREVFDLFGIRFLNHPNLKRILMPVDWQGNPLRKDYPVHGHKYSYQDE